MVDKLSWKEKQALFAKWNPKDLVDDGGDTDMDQTEADTKKDVEAVAKPNTGHQASSRTIDQSQAVIDTKELKAEVFLQAAQHQQEGRLEKTVNDHNKVTTVGTDVELAEAARRAARFARFAAKDPAEERKEAAARARCEVSATLAKTAPMDLVDEGVDTDKDQTETDTKVQDLEAAATPYPGHQASSLTKDQAQAEIDTKELKAEVLLQESQHQQEEKLEQTVYVHNKVATEGTYVETAAASSQAARNARYKARFA